VRISFDDAAIEPMNDRREEYYLCPSPGVEQHGHFDPQVCFESTRFFRWLGVSRSGLAGYDRKSVRVDCAGEGGRGRMVASESVRDKNGECKIAEKRIEAFPWQSMNVEEKLTTLSPCGEYDFRHTRCEI